MMASIVWPGCLLACMLLLLLNTINAAGLRGGSSLASEAGPRVETFPYAVCERKGKSPFTLTHSATTKNDDGTVRHCFKLSADPTATGPGNCTLAYQQQGLRSLEIGINPECRRAVKMLAFNNTLVHTCYQSFHGRGYIFKVAPGKGRNLASFEQLAAKDAALCFTLTSDCADLNTFCRRPSCELAFFNADRTCCQPAVLSMTKKVAM